MRIVLWPFRHSFLNCLYEHIISINKRIVTFYSCCFILVFLVLLHHQSVFPCHFFAISCSSDDFDGNGYISLKGCLSCFSPSLGSIWSSFRTSTRNTRSPRDYIQGGASWILPHNPKRIGRVGWFWARILHQLSQPWWVEESTHGLWFRTSSRHGHCGEDFAASHQSGGLEQR